MKTNYRKEINLWRDDDRYYYENVCGGYHRHIYTFSELRANSGARSDYRRDPDFAQLTNLLPRGRRTARYLDTYNDYSRCRNNGRSWKDYTKNRKQWEMGFEPAPRTHKLSALEQAILSMTRSLKALNEESEEDGV